MSMPIGHFEPESVAVSKPESNEAIEPLVDIILGKLLLFIYQLFVYILF